MKSSACKMVYTLIRLMRTLDKMLEECTIVMKLLYYDDVTPMDYEPPFFKGCTKEEVHNTGTKNLLKMEIGNVNIKHFALALKVKSVFDPCEDENDDASLGADPVERDEGLLKIAKGCHLLEKFDLCQWPSISNKGVIAITENLSASSVLSRVRFHTWNIRYFSIAVIGHYGKAITNLVLSVLQNVSQEGFWSLRNARALNTLVPLLITSCRGETDVSLEAIGKGCPNLKRMSTILSSLELDKIIQDFFYTKLYGYVKRITCCYQELSEPQLITICDLFKFLISNLEDKVSVKGEGL